MIARVADHCFRFGRYIERVDSMTRVLHVTLHLSLDAELSGRQCWQPVLVVSGEKQRFAALHGEDAMGDGERIQRYSRGLSMCIITSCRSMPRASKLLSKQASGSRFFVHAPAGNPT